MFVLKASCIKIFYVFPFWYQIKFRKKNSTNTNDLAYEIKWKTRVCVRVTGLFLSGMEVTYKEKSFRGVLLALAMDLLTDISYLV